MFNLPTSNRTMALVLTKPLIDMSTKKLTEDQVRPELQADLKNVGISTSHYLMGLYGLLKG
jgi:hypothetical protein